MWGTQMSRQWQWQQSQGDGLMEWRGELAMAEDKHEVSRQQGWCDSGGCINLAKVGEVAEGLARIGHGGGHKWGIWVGLRWWQMLGSKGLCTAAYSAGVNGSRIQCDSVMVVQWMVLLYGQPINSVLDGVTITCCFVRWEWSHCVFLAAFLSFDTVLARTLETLCCRHGCLMVQLSSDSAPLRTSLLVPNRWIYAIFWCSGWSLLSFESATPFHQSFEQNQTYEYSPFLTWFRQASSIWSFLWLLGSCLGSDGVSTTCLC